MIGLAGALLLGAIPGASAAANEIGVDVDSGSCEASGGSAVVLRVDGTAVGARMCILFDTTDKDGTGLESCGSSNGVILRHEGRIVGACLRTAGP